VTRTLLPRSALLPAAAAVALVLCGCGPDAAAGSAAPASSPAGGPAAVPSAALPTGPFGPGCSSVPASGVGSAAAMAAEPVVAAAAHTPLLTSLAAAVERADLADPLDARRAITVLAPADPAFEAVPGATLKALMADTAKLTQLLTHHVLEGRLTPAQLAGTHTTLNNDTVTIDRTGSTFTLSAGQTLGGTRTATVVCGNLQTANATVYVIDQVLAPPAA
jgi:uncharacterized surface protein with fasciclin (FAS1) repeats